MSETTMVTLIVAVSIVVMCIAWLVYLGRGGKPLNVSLNWLGLSLKIEKPSSGRGEN